MRHYGHGLATATRERGQLPRDSGVRTRAVELAFLEPLTARRATCGATKSHARRWRKASHDGVRSSDGSCLALVPDWRDDQVANLRQLRLLRRERTCASEREAGGFAAEIAAAMHCGWDDTSGQFPSQLRRSR